MRGTVPTRGKQQGAPHSERCRQGLRCRKLKHWPGGDAAGRRASLGAAAVAGGSAEPGLQPLRSGWGPPARMGPLDALQAPYLPPPLGSGFLASALLVSLGFYVHPSRGNVGAPVRTGAPHGAWLCGGLLPCPDPAGPGKVQPCSEPAGLRQSLLGARTGQAPPLSGVPEVLGPQDQ